MKHANAWLLPLIGERLAAIGERELHHLVHEPRPLTVPLTPDYCRHVLAWEHRVLALWDVGTWIADRAGAATVPVAAVIAFQSSPRETAQFGALALSAPPIRIKVSDEQACALPADKSAWSSIALSCFTHQGQAVPILDLRRMFGPVPNADQSRRVDAVKAIKSNTVTLEPTT